MVSHEKRARELAKLYIKLYQPMYEEPCLSMSKGASPGQKKEIEDFHTKRILGYIKKEGLEAVETQAKLGSKYLKLHKQFKNANRTKKQKNKNNRSLTCKYIRKTGSYTRTSR